MFERPFVTPWNGLSTRLGGNYPQVENPVSRSLDDNKVGITRLTFLHEGRHVDYFNNTILEIDGVHQLKDGNVSVKLLCKSKHLADFL